MDTPILTLDDVAAAKLQAMKEAGRFEGSLLRLMVREEGAAYDYRLEVVEESVAAPEDTKLEASGIPILLDAVTIENLRGATLEYAEDLSGGGFRFKNPNRPALLENPIAVRVQQVLDEKINPSVADHGGRVSLVDVQEGRVFLRFGGGCQGCGMVDVTLKQGIEALLRQEIPEVLEVLDTTDHAQGDNPYYSSAK